MSNQSFIFNLKIKINENNEGEVLYNNSSSKLKYEIFCYMNDKKQYNNICWQYNGF